MCAYWPIDIDFTDVLNVYSRIHLGNHYMLLLKLRLTYLKQHFRRQTLHGHDKTNAYNIVGEQAVTTLPFQFFNLLSQCYVEQP